MGFSKPMITNSLTPRLPKPNFLPSKHLSPLPWRPPPPQPPFSPLLNPFFPHVVAGRRLPPEAQVPPPAMAPGGAPPRGPPRLLPLRSSRHRRPLRRLGPQPSGGELLRRVVPLSERESQPHRGRVLAVASAGLRRERRRRGCGALAEV